uniref:Disease resistance protein n=1 Tax=Anisakis simplex TaxID=6269 RepID=A0A0M3JMB0_ANISI
LRQVFAEKANTVGPWLERQLESVLSIGMGGRGSLENAITQLKNIQQQVHFRLKFCVVLLTDIF